MGDSEHTPRPITRRLAAILHADVQGYSRLIEKDELSTLRVLTPYLAMMTEYVRQHDGQPVGSRGDSLLAEFPSARSAVQCAIEMQRELQRRNAELPAEQRIAFRMGIHVGEIVADGEQVHGDGINIAVRLESLAEAGGILISGTVYDQVKTKLVLQYEALGEQHLKNIAEPVRVWRIVLDGSESPKSKVQSLKGKVERQKPRKVGTSVFVSVLVLLLGGLVTLWSFFPSVFRIPHSALRTQEAQPPSLPLPDKPSIVVLPFTNMSGDPEQEYFSDGLTEDLTTGLAKISSLFVIARNSAFTYKGKAVKVQDVSREMGVRYVLEGSVRRADEQMRVTVQLIDGLTGGHLWAERFDRPLKDIFAVQDEIVRKIITTLKLQLTLQEQGILVRKTTDNPEAYDFLLRGVEHFNRQTPEANVQARQMFEKAVELDQTYAEAYAWLGYTYWQEWWSQWNLDPQNLERALALAQKASALDDSLPFAYSLLTGVYLQHKQHEQALAAAERTRALARNSALSCTILGATLNFVGRPEEAVGLIEQAMRLDPRSPVFYLWTLGQTYRLMGRYEEAVAAQKRALSRNPNHLPSYVHLASMYGELGRAEEARTAAAEILRLSPHFSIESLRPRLPYKDPAVVERILEGLRKAGLK